MVEATGIRIRETGGPEVMGLETFGVSDPGPDEIRVHHSAIGVNFIDTYHRGGLYPLDMPSGIGLEGAGTVDAVGSNVTRFREGDRVGYCTGPIGAYASHHIVKADRAVALPPGISDDHAAASMLKGLTTQYLIRQIYRVAAGETVVFHAAAGGVGQLATQWLKHLGATVIATAGGAAKCDLVRSLGADHVIDYDHEDIAARVREITDGAGVPVVFDGVGKATWEASLDCLRPRGLMVSFGNASGPVEGVNLGILAAKGSLFVTRPTLFHYTPTPEALQAAADDFFEAVLAVGVKIGDPQVYPLAEAAQAHTDLERRKTTGSLILRP